MSDFLDSKPYIFGFQIHHIMAVDVFDTFDELLLRNGITQDMKGNKVALPAMISVQFR